MISSSLMHPLSIEKILELFAEEGPIAQAIPGFEVRKEQLVMIEEIVSGYQRDRIVLVEAGTGTGKSMAYLVPALLWAAKTGERTVISTYTINLQEQLLKKDIPLLKKALGIDCRVALMKGMRNYLCRRRLNESMMERLLMTESEREELEAIADWAERTPTGTRSSLPIALHPGTWDRIAAEHDTCSYQRCPFYKECHFFRARNEAKEAQLIVVNHHLLFSDLNIRRKRDEPNGEGILPSYQRLILDEAHHVEKVATEFLGSRISRLQLLRTLGRIAAEKGTGGKLIQLREKLTQGKKSREPLQAILQKIGVTLPMERHTLLEAIIKAFQSIELFVEEVLANQKGTEREGDHIRIQPHHHEKEIWKEHLIPDTEELTKQLAHYANSVESLIIDVQNLPDKDLAQGTEGIGYELNALARRLREGAAFLHRCIMSAIPLGSVRWVERSRLRLGTNIEWIEAPLDISTIISESLFTPLRTTVLCSATLTTQKSFSFLRHQLGILPHLLEEKEVKETILPSPFNYAERVYFAVPIDMPLPSEKSFTQEVIRMVREIIRASRGNTLVLFTSYRQMNEVYRALEEEFSLLRQGERSDHEILERFRQGEGSTLFATSSFWEGIDVVGDALRCVVLVKLPFPVPTEPIIEARMEAMEAEGTSSFWGYSIPQAIVRFKQGFGRLIRNKEDRGCIVCLDSRLIKKGYGKAFLSSLPPCRTVFASQPIVAEQIGSFLWDLKGVNNY